MWEFSAKWVLKCLNADQKRQRCQSCEKHLEFFQSDRNDFLSDANSYHGKKPGYVSMAGDKATVNGVAEYRVTSPPKLQSAKIHWKSSCLDFLG